MDKPIETAKRCGKLYNLKIYNRKAIYPKAKPERNPIPKSTKFKSASKSPKPT